MRRFAVVVCAMLMGSACALAADWSSLPPEAQKAIAAAIERDAAWRSPGKAIQHFTLAASDGQDKDDFGGSVAIDGDTVVVGQGVGFSTKAYVFTKPRSGWQNMTQTAELTPSDPQNAEGFGGSVAISGDTIVVGADEATLGNEFQGAAYVFVKPAGGWTNMNETAVLSASDGVTDSGFGSSVAISGGTIAVGAPDGTNNNVGPGIVYEFTEPANGWASMTQTAELTASDGYEYDGFGESVAVSGSTIVSAICGCGSGNPQGAAYVFVEPSNGWTDMTQTATLTASDGHEGNVFGFAVAVDGDTAIVGAPGQGMEGTVYVFVQPHGGWADMTQTAELTIPGDQYGLGDSVAISGTVVLAGNPDIDHGNGCGFVFVKPAGGWRNATNYDYALGVTFSYWANYLGEAVAISDTTAVVAAPAAPSMPPCGPNGCTPGPGEAFIFAEQ